MIWDSILILKETILLRSTSSLVQVPSRSTHSSNWSTRPTTCTQLTKSLTTPMRILKAMTTMSKTVSNLLWTLNNQLVTSNIVHPKWDWSISALLPSPRHLLTRKIKAKTCSSHAAIGRRTEKLKRQWIFNSSARKTSWKKMAQTSMIPMNNLAPKTPKVQLIPCQLKDAREKPS